MKTQTISDEKLIEQAINFYQEICRKENIEPRQPDPAFCQVSNKKIYLVNKIEGIAIVRIHHNKLYYKLNRTDYNCPIKL